MTMQLTHESQMSQRKKSVDLGILFVGFVLPPSPDSHMNKLLQKILQ